MYAPSIVPRPQIPDAPVVDDNNGDAGMPLLFTVAARAALPRLFDQVWAAATLSNNTHAVLWYGPTGRYGLKYFPESADLAWLLHHGPRRPGARRNLFNADMGIWATEADRAPLEPYLAALAAYPLWNMVASRVSGNCLLTTADYAVQLLPSRDDFGSGYLIVIGPAELERTPPPIDWERAQNRWNRLDRGSTAVWAQTPTQPSEFDVSRPDLLDQNLDRQRRIDNIVELTLYLQANPTAPTTPLRHNSLFTGSVNGLLYELPARMCARSDPAIRWRLFGSRCVLPLYAARFVNDRPVIDELTNVAARHLGEMLRVTNPNVYRHLGGPAVTQTGQLL